MVTQVKGSVSEDLEATIASDIATQRTADIDTRIGTTGNLGTAATRDTGNSDGEIPTLISETVVLGGDFDAGESVLCSKFGRLVTISSVTGNLTHASTNNPQSPQAIIPIAYRPAAGIMSSTYGLAGNVIRNVRVTNSGRLDCYYDDRTGSPFVSTTTGEPITITYLV